MHPELQEYPVVLSEHRLEPRALRRFLARLHRPVNQVAVVILAGNACDHGLLDFIPYGEILEQHDSPPARVRISGRIFQSPNSLYSVLREPVLKEATGPGCPIQAWFWLEWERRSRS